MNPNSEEKVKSIELAAREGDYKKQLSCSLELAQSQDVYYAAIGYYYIGLYHLMTGHGSSRFPDAISAYRKSYELYKSYNAALALTRVLIQSTKANFNEIKEMLDYAHSQNDSADVDLGYAAIYFYRLQPDYKLARKYFLRAAFRGRVYGLFGYSIASRQMKQYFRAFIVDLLRIIATPFYSLFFGKKSRHSYFWAPNLLPFMSVKQTGRSSLTFE